MKEFNTHGGYFAPQGYSKVTEGGSHEQNPNGGVQIGVDPEGIPNMLEEGEPIYDDFVYSDNIKADKKFLKENKLPEKYSGKLYSEIADAILDESKERPMDAISENGLESMLSRLADAQEKQKQYTAQRDISKELDSLSPEELSVLDQMLANGQQQNVVPEQTISPVPVEQQPDNAQQVTFACGGKVRNFAEGTPGRVQINGEINPVTISAYNPYTQHVIDARNNFVNDAAKALPEITEPLVLVPGIGTAVAAADGILSAASGDKSGVAGSSILLTSPILKKVSSVAKTAEAVANAAKSTKTIAAGVKKASKTAGKVLGTALAPGTSIATKAFTKKPGIGKGAIGLLGDTVYWTGASAALPEGGIPGVLSDRFHWEPKYDRSGHAEDYDFDYSSILGDTLDTKDILPANTRKCGGRINKFARGGEEDNVADVFNGGIEFLDAQDIMSQPNIVGQINPTMVYGGAPIKQSISGDKFTVTNPGLAPISSQYLKNLDHNHDYALTSTMLDAVDGNGSDYDNSWLRYLAPIGNSILGLFNASQPTDKYSVRTYTPVIPSARMHLTQPRFTPIDRNELANTLRATYLGTLGNIRNSGVGPGTYAAIIAADNRTTGNIADSLVKASMANDQMRNSVISQRNQNEGTLANFRYNVDSQRAQILNDATLRNIQNELMLQRLNNAVEGEKYAAVSNQIDKALSDLSAMGIEAHRLNTANDMFDGYSMKDSGNIVYIPVKG